MAINSYPLAWPQQFPRQKHREVGKFNTSLGRALANVESSLEKFAKDTHRELDDIVVSTNVTLAKRRPDDPGVAVWFLFDGLQVCIPIDRYTTVESNLQAIHHVIQARRAELRHGTLALVRASFGGFLLSAPTGNNWADVLGVRKRASQEEIKEAYRKLVSEHHPDRGGDHHKMTEINNAWQQAQQEVEYS
jgi:hypothetical protein